MAYKQLNNILFKGVAPLLNLCGIFNVITFLILVQFFSQLIYVIKDSTYIPYMEYTKIGNCISLA